MSLLSDSTLQIVLLAALFVVLEGRGAVSRQLWNVLLKIKLFSRSSAWKCLPWSQGTEPQSPG